MKSWRPGSQNQWVQQDPPHFSNISCKKTTRVALVSAPQNTKFFKGHARKKNTIKHPNKQALMIDYTDLSQIESTSVESMRKRNAAVSCLVWRVNQMKAKVQPTYWPAQSQLPGEWVTRCGVGNKLHFPAWQLGSGCTRAGYCTHSLVRRVRGKKVLRNEGDKKRNGERKKVRKEVHNFNQEKL